MDIFHFLTICPPEIKELALSDKPGQIIMGLESKYNLNSEQGDRLTDLTRQLLFGLVPVDSLSSRIGKILTGDAAKSSSLEKDFRQALIIPYQKYLKQTDDQVTQFKAKNNLPEIVVFSAPPPVPSPKTSLSRISGKSEIKPGAAWQKQSVANQSHSVPTTADIRPFKRKLPPRQPVSPATPVRPSTFSPRIEASSVSDQFQLRTVDDLINVPAATLQKEPDDEKKLVGRFKQEIQDIANHSGAKRTEIVAGWKKSQIYQAYIEMGNDSIQQGKPIGDVMAFRKAAGKPYLTENQFHAVSEISRLLLR